MANIKAFIKKYDYGFTMLLYGIIYLAWFNHLEKNTPADFRVIHMALDDYIPFCEWFVLPYFIWFAYMLGVIVYFMFTDKEEYFKVFTFLATGMTVFLLISTLFPNGHQLRPMAMPRNNVLTHMVRSLYRTDTPTNLWPSIHVYNSLGANIAIWRSKKFGDNKPVKIVSAIICTSIILSTMFIKQHSVFDVCTAFIMAAVMYVLVYRKDLVDTVETLETSAEAVTN
ncbi:MAG: serine/threonine protein phosphatase [Lachnospiraceae bacterium]|nr:serine/threonine protein phosphatase [Lachnospiraceae bacterium]